MDYRVLDVSHVDVSMVESQYDLSNIARHCIKPDNTIWSMTQNWFNFGSGNGLLPDGTITWTNVDLSSVMSCGIDLGAVLQEMLKMSILDKSMKIKITDCEITATFPRGQWVN